MKKIAYIILVITAIVAVVRPVAAETKLSSSGDVCEVKCRLDEGVICLERGPCEPNNEALLKAAKECRENPAAKYTSATKLLSIISITSSLRISTSFPLVLFLKQTFAVCAFMEWFKRYT